MRGKDEYELGDLTVALDTISKDLTCQLTGKGKFDSWWLMQREYDNISFVYHYFIIVFHVFDTFHFLDDYEFGDLSNELDKRVKSSIAEYCGKESYEFGDLSAEVNRRSRSRILEFIDKDEYEFGDITRAIESRRREWISGFLGEEAAKNYEFGDITKKALTSFTGKVS